MQCSTVLPGRIATFLFLHSHGAGNTQSILQSQAADVESTENALPIFQKLLTHVASRMGYGSTIHTAAAARSVRLNTQECFYVRDNDEH